MGSSAEQSPRVVVIGASAGGFAALTTLVSQLPASFPAVVFAVLHIAPDFPAEDFAARLDREGGMHWKLPKHEERFKVGTGYIAPPDVHMLVKERTVLVTKGAHENRHRPGIDPLFRSAAVAHGSRVVGVVLTGMLDDGTAGLEAVARCGGVTVVQEPSDAAFPAMPQSALDHVRVDERATIAHMGALLDRLVRAPVTKSKKPPEDVGIEALIAERVVSDVVAANALGVQVPYNCPDCGGVLWQMSQPKVLRYRCHVGHAFTAASLFETQSRKIEETLWITLRMLEERRNLAGSMAKKTSLKTSEMAAARAREADVHIKRIREILGTAR
ncbi:MAG: CheB methylesterase [Myxococcaceae bacterium]|nr:CheB methylesterase [Myxococcaceae bacterium]MEA2751752.1 two-component system, chemotaxis family, protein-glutamate methylesterase/glutaminase [Myxococcales bacterium]